MPFPAHPRWRGEQRQQSSYSHASHGSSPLARGTVGAFEIHSAGERFIPAGAGNRKELAAAQRRYSVHPRWRGEQPPVSSMISSSFGSSPLARGTVLGCIALLLLDRFIPAGAGNSTPSAFSAPRLRFIPAGAGNSCCIRPASRSYSVHPRWRGEQPMPGADSSPVFGSSPLARGTDGNTWVQSVQSRFIPAGAGNSRPAPAPAKRQPVHPRWRGEQPMYNRQSTICRGSSPLARGTVAAKIPTGANLRFIPAGAGNSHEHHSLRHGTSVHPRWRGEQGS